MSDYPDYVTCPNCGNARAESEMHVVEWIGCCIRVDDGCGHIWSLESGISYGFSDVEQRQ